MVNLKHITKYKKIVFVIFLQKKYSKILIFLREKEMNEKNNKLTLFNFELIGKDIKLDFTKHLTKKDKELFRNIKLQKYNHISLNKFFEIFNLSEKQEVLKYLNNLMNKSIIISSKENNYFICINIIQSYYINNDIIYLVFSDEITNSFKKGSFFDKIGLRNILFLEEKFSYRLYQYIYNNKDNNIYIPIENLRDILEIGDSYKRFYDIEKNLLLPIFDDIKKNGNIDLEYEKIKNGEHKSAKILGISIIKKFNSNIPNEDSTTQFIDSLMIKLGKNIKNFSEIYSLLNTSLAEHGEEFVKNKVDYVLMNFEVDIEKHLYLSLNQNESLEKADYILKKNFTSLFQMHTEILLFIQKNNLPQLSKYMFTITLYSLKDKESVVLKDKSMSIKITYNKNDISVIEFYLHK